MLLIVRIKKILHNVEKKPSRKFMSTGSYQLVSLSLTLSIFIALFFKRFFKGFISSLFRISDFIVAWDNFLNRFTRKAQLDNLIRVREREKIFSIIIQRLLIPQVLLRLFSSFLLFLLFENPIETFSLAVYPRKPLNQHWQ